MQKIRKVVQFVFLIIFWVMIFSKNLKIWMGISFVMILISLVWGRIYCAWVCPINSVITPLQRIKDKLDFGNNKVFGVFKNEIIRYVFFAIFMAGFIYKQSLMKRGIQFPLPIIILLIGIIMTFSFNAKTWHRYMCPWGFLLSITSRFSKTIISKNEKCNSCGLCNRVCDGDAINSKNEVDKKNCLMCFKCIESCPKNKKGG